MNILLTGSTGFLGKQVLSRLVKNPDIQKIYVVIRKAHSHPSPKVKILKFDLSRTFNLPIEVGKLDAVIHLAASYDLRASYADNYLHNVCATMNLLSALEGQDDNLTFHYSSTYAVLNGSSDLDSCEEPIDFNPSRIIPYAYTKALNERIIEKSRFRTFIYRLGVLVAETETGKIEKLDGPYMIMNFLYRLKKILKYFPSVPLPINPLAFLPLVPVNVAAEVFVASLFLSVKGSRIFGVFDPESILIQDFTQLMWDNFSFPGKPNYRNFLTFKQAARFDRFLPVPASFLEFGQNSPSLKNPNFLQTFKHSSVPRFHTYAPKFFQGFHEYQERNG